MEQDVVEGEGRMKENLEMASYSRAALSHSCY